MTIRVVFSDLDGTMLEPDGRVAPEVIAEVTRLAGRGIPVCPVTSKTAAELRAVAAALGIAAPCGFENGAGALLPDRRLVLSDQAVPIAALRAVAEAVRDTTGAPLRTFDELGDEELRLLTGLDGAALAAARERHASLPLLVDPAWDDVISGALPARPAVRVVRGNRFLHLQGQHDKATVLPHLERYAPSRGGSSVACGDSPNDAGMLCAVDIAVIVPSISGPDISLKRARPDAIIAPRPHGRGWADALQALVREEME